MILIINLKEMEVEAHTTLVGACKRNKMLRYQYLKEIKLSKTMRKYKGVYITKV